MDSQGQPEFVRTAHVRYELEREEADPVEGETGDGSELVGVRVRLLAHHDRERLGTPGCPACERLLGELRSFAEQVAAEAGAGDRAEVIPATQKLYEAPDDRTQDEVAVTLRVRCAAPEHGRGDEDRCVGSVRERLEALGVARG
ncbi:MAG: hypothetical protein QM704_00645 [Anaeromyxobacteraceae bacterium]